jgi:hypothetical protein
MDKARRELHAVDRRDWPPLALMYGLPWEQYFEKKEAVLFENPVVGACPQGVVARVCSRWLAGPLFCARALASFPVATQWHRVHVTLHSSCARHAPSVPLLCPAASI